MSKSEKFWDKAAEKYANSPVSDEQTYQKKLAETEEFLAPDMRLLEFGCGTGTTALHHAPKVQHVDALDISENMLTIARRKARERGIDNITFTHSTLAGFHAKTASVDAVLGLNVIHLIPDRHRIITEITRILKPAGIVVLSTVCLGDSCWRFFKPLIPLGKLSGLMPDLFIIKANELTSEIQEAGFTIERRWFHGKGNIVMFMIARKNI